jgi:hypothetical protein
MWVSPLMPFVLQLGLAAGSDHAWSSAVLDPHRSLGAVPVTAVVRGQTTFHAVSALMLSACRYFGKLDQGHYVLQVYFNV